MSKKTICGVEYLHATGTYVCTRQKGHTGLHKQGRAGVQWGRGEQDEVAPPEVDSRSEQAKSLSALPPLEKEPKINREAPSAWKGGVDSTPAIQPRTVEFQDGLKAIETKNTVNIVVSDDCLLVDKLLFSRMVKAVARGANGGLAYANQGGITKFGMIMRGKNHEEYKELYRACLEVVDQDNKRQRQ